MVSLIQRWAFRTGDFDEFYSKIRLLEHAFILSCLQFVFLLRARWLLQSSLPHSFYCSPILWWVVYLSSYDAGVIIRRNKSCSCFCFDSFAFLLTCIHCGRTHEELPSILCNGIHLTLQRAEIISRTNPCCIAGANIALRIIWCCWIDKLLHPDCDHYRELGINLHFGSYFQKSCPRSFKEVDRWRGLYVRIWAMLPSKRKMAGNAWTAAGRGAEGTLGVLVGTTMYAGIPLSWAAKATAAAWFPELWVTTPLAAWASEREKTALLAPLNLNAPLQSHWIVLLQTGSRFTCHGYGWNAAYKACIKMCLPSLVHFAFEMELLPD